MRILFFIVLIWMLPISISLASTYASGPYLARVREAELAVLAAPMRESSHWKKDKGQGKELVTVTLFRVLETIKSPLNRAVDKEIAIERKGGKIGQLELTVGAQIRFQEGEKYGLLLMGPRDDSDYFQLLDAEVSVMDAKYDEALQDYRLSGGVLALDPLVKGSVPLAELKNALLKDPALDEIIASPPKIMNSHEIDSHESMFQDSGSAPLQSQPSLLTKESAPSSATEQSKGSLHLDSSHSLKKPSDLRSSVFLKVQGVTKERVFVILGAVIIAVLMYALNRLIFKSKQ